MKRVKITLHGVQECDIMKQFIAEVPVTFDPKHFTVEELEALSDDNAIGWQFVEEVGEGSDSYSSFEVSDPDESDESVLPSISGVRVIEGKSDS